MVAERLGNGAPQEALLAADGSPRLPHVAYDDDGYPNTDGEPLGQNLIQVERIHDAFGALRGWVRERLPGAFIGCDMFVYRRRGVIEGSVAPDVFVALGVGDDPPWDSYKLFEGRPVPSFVLEVLSGGTADKDLGDKRDAYAAMGVKEYFMLDPFRKRIPEGLSAERLHEGVYKSMCQVEGDRGYRSDALGLELHAAGDRLRFRDPATGEDLMDFDEHADAQLVAEARADTAEARADTAEARAVAEAEARRAAEAELARLKRLLAAGGTPEGAA